MPGTVKDRWDTDSGLPDSVAHAAIEVWFGPNEQSEFDNERIYLNLRGPAIDLDEGQPVGDEEGLYTLRLSIGNNWEVGKNGKVVSHTAGGTKFHQSTGLGKFIKAIGALLDEDSKLAKALDARGQTYEAATYQNLAFRYARQQFTFKNSEGEETEYSLLLPAGFLGVGADAIGVGAEESEDVAPAKPTRRKKAAAKGDQADQTALRQEVITYAAQFEADEHEDFVEEVLDADVFPQANEIGEELKAEILDAESDLWAEAH